MLIFISYVSYVEIKYFFLHSLFDWVAGWGIHPCLSFLEFLELCSLRSPWFLYWSILLLYCFLSNGFSYYSSKKKFISYELIFFFFCFFMKITLLNNFLYFVWKLHYYICGAKYLEHAHTTTHVYVMVFFFFLVWFDLVFELQFKCGYMLIHWFCFWDFRFIFALWMNDNVVEPK